MVVKKIGIITLWTKDANFGSTIQNWALHQYLQKTFFVDTVTIVNKKYAHLDQNLKYFYNFPEQTWQAFDEFKKTIKHRVCMPSEIKETDASLFVIGGDQITNSYSMPSFDIQYNLLSNIPKRKKILYSAGMPCQQFSVPHNVATDACYRELTTNIQALSFREKLNEFPYQTQYIDPTLLLDRKCYEEIEEKPNGKIPRNFDFLYVVKHSEREFSNILAFLLRERKNDCPLITNRDNLNLGPKQILWCIHHCKCLYTNSFHGFVFSVIFNKKVVLSNPNEFRINNLINFLNLRYKNGEIINYKRVQKNILEQQKRSFDYFDKNFREYKETEENNYPIMYAAYRKEQKLRDFSSSGGVSAALAETIFERNGIVYGAAYAQDFRSVRHIPVTDMNTYYHLIASSKYSISSLNGIFPRIKTDLEKGVWVMFTGTPCQVYALKKYLNKDYSNLLTVDLLCHGVSKRIFLKKYIDKLEKECKSHLVKLNMRMNHQIALTALTESGETIVDTKVVRELFINPNALHNMCNTCNKHSDNNASDITLGDFWDIEKYFPNDPVFNIMNVAQNGINLIKINTKKGKTFWRLIQNGLEFKKVEA